MDSAVLKDNQIAVVALTAGEADTLEADQNILLVEEDILLFGSSAEKSKKKQAKQEKFDIVRTVEKTRKGGTVKCSGAENTGGSRPLRALRRPDAAGELNESKTVSKRGK